jgi:hypothetical protein
VQTIRGADDAGRPSAPAKGPRNPNYEVTQAGGVLEMGSERIVAHLVLMPRVNYPPQLRWVLSTVLQGINAG